ncbi:MAG: DUF1043 family protein [Porticoccaceae bacterium]|nr:YhcB family protein [Pseudomonadales bacterium]MCP5172585.1 YhcB family protein [Pseudomonadales bacterium]MCP5303501.1 YhcB family protein [Pseudomonadales bacterium]
MDISTLFIALAALALGLVIGFLLTRTLHPQEKQRKEVEEQLQQVRQEHKDYQHKVTEHFITTSTLVNDMTESYRGLHEHLAASAMHLTNPEISRQMIEAGYGRISGDIASETLARTVSSEIPSPPKDYAPKVPGGVLSEDYGLEDSSDFPPNPKGNPKKDKPAKKLNDELNDDPTLKVG